MAAPHRGNNGLSSYFITAATFQKQSLFQSVRMADLFLDAPVHYRSQQKYLLHESVIMPDHFHLLLTPALTLERALQLVKGGFSFRAKKELGFSGEIWEKSFYDRRVRDWQEHCAFRQYIHLNAVKKGLAGTVEEYPYSSAKPCIVLDAAPQRLKPLGLRSLTSAAKAAELKKAMIAALKRCATQKRASAEGSSTWGTGCYHFTCGAATESGCALEA